MRFSRRKRLSASSTGSRVLADVNVWLATLVQQHPHHESALGWWRRQVLPDGHEVLFCRVTQLGLLRLLSNATVMGASRRTPRQAWRDYDRLVAQGPVGYLAEPPHVARILRGHTLDEDASASLWTDAYLAAFAQAAEVSLATFDRGFSRFSGLRLHLLS